MDYCCCSVTQSVRLFATPQTPAGPHHLPKFAQVHVHCHRWLEYYSATKRNELLTHTTTPMDLQGFMRSLKSQSQKVICSMSPSYIEMENRLMVTQHKELAIIGDGGKKVLVIQLCSTLCDPLDYSPPGSSIHGIFQARIQECHFLLQGIFLTQGLNRSLLCLLRWQAGSLPLAPPGKPAGDGGGDDKGVSSQ